MDVDLMFMVQFDILRLLKVCKIALGLIMKVVGGLVRKVW